MLSNSFSQLVEEQVNNLMVAKPVQSGKLIRVVGLTLEAKGVVAPLGAFCEVEGSGSQNYIGAEIVGFQGDTIFLMPFGEPKGLSPGARVRVLANHANVMLGEDLLGRVSARRRAWLLKAVGCSSSRD